MEAVPRPRVPKFGKRKKNQKKEEKLAKKERSRNRTMFAIKWIKLVGDERPQKNLYWITVTLPFSKTYFKSTNLRLAILLHFP